jgi:membrane protein implicated in regulation of membrane protease activity
MEAITYYYLIAFGILLIGIEALTFSFVLFFIGVGFILVGVLSYFEIFTNGWAQIATALVIALAGAFAFRKPLLKYLFSSKKQKETKVHMQGIGIIEESMVKFNGSYWQSWDDLSQYKDGDRVRVVKVEDNKVFVEPLS